MAKKDNSLYDVLSKAKAAGERRAEKFKDLFNQIDKDIVSAVESRVKGEQEGVKVDMEVNQLLEDLRNLLLDIEQKRVLINAFELQSEEISKVEDPNLKRSLRRKYEKEFGDIVKDKDNFLKKIRETCGKISTALQGSLYFEGKIVANIGDIENHVDELVQEVLTLETE